MIKILDLSLGYNKKKAPVVSKCSFSLKGSQIGIILGPNGAGKTTLLKGVLGLMKPISGKIEIEGKDILEMKANDRAKLISYVPQSFDFAPSSVYDYVMLGRIPHFAIGPKEKDHACVIEALEKMGIKEFASRNVLSLSGGEKQKVMIARALSTNSQVIVFDEPSANLDMGASHLLLDLIKNLSESEGKTVLISMHDINMAYDYGDYFAFMKNGKIHKQGGKEIFDEESLSSLYGIKVAKMNGEKTYFVYGGKQ